MDNVLYVAGGLLLGAGFFPLVKFVCEFMVWLEGFNV